MACENYQIDMTAASFGACKCGHAKAEHTIVGGPKKGGGKVASPFKAKAAPVAAATEEDNGGGACTNYRVNMAAAAFGECKCGRPKSEHAASGPGLSKVALQKKAAKEAAEKEEKAAAEAAAAAAIEKEKQEKVKRLATDR
jgi:hypothetical protein